MEYLLIIDDDPIYGAFAQEAMGSGWTVLSVLTGLDGVMLLHHESRISVVVLDVCMPGLDGYQTAAELRRINQTVRIVPFTMLDPLQDAPWLSQYMDELGCAPVVQKGVDLATFRQSILHAHASIPRIQQSAVLQQYQRETYRWAQALRRQTTSIRGGIYATSLVAQQGLQAILSGCMTNPPLAIHGVTDTWDVLSALHKSDQLDIMVISTTDSNDALSWVVHQTPVLPVVVLSDTTAAGYVVAQQRQRYLTHPIGIVVATQSLLTHLPLAITAVLGGASYVDPALTVYEQTQCARIRMIVEQSYRVVLRPDELTLLQLELGRWTNTEIATLLGKTTQGVYSLRSRLLKKLQVRDMPTLLQTLEDHLT